MHGWTDGMTDDRMEKARCITARWTGRATGIGMLALWNLLFRIKAYNSEIFKVIGVDPIYLKLFKQTTFLLIIFDIICSVHE